MVALLLSLATFEGKKATRSPGGPYILQSKKPVGESRCAILPWVGMYGELYSHPSTADGLKKPLNQKKKKLR